MVRQVDREIGGMMDRGRSSDLGAPLGGMTGAARPGYSLATQSGMRVMQSAWSWTEQITLTVGGGEEGRGSLDMTL